MANTLYEFYGGKLPSIQERSKVFESYGLGSAKDYKGTADQNIALLGKLQTSSQQAQPANNAVPKVNSADEATTYLKNFQTQLYDKSTTPDGKSDIQNLLPSTPAPTPINRVETLEKLRTEYKVGDLETELNTLKDEKRIIEESQRKRVANEQGKPVALGVIAGRTDEITRQENEKLDFVNRKLQAVNDELTTKYSTIKTLIDFKGLDYNDAVEAYDKEFDRNVKMYSLISAEQNEIKDSARANLQIIQNSIIKGNATFSSLPAETQATITKLELQSGLPIGFTASLKADPNANIIFTTSNEGVTQVGFRNADGTVEVKSYGTRISSNSEADKKRSYTNSAVQDASNGVTLKDMFKIYQGYLDPNDIYTIYNANSIYGEAKSDANNGGWTPEKLAQYGVKQINNQ